MNRRTHGFTLVETLLAIIISSMVIGIVTYLVHNFFSEQRNLEVWSSGQLEMSSSLKDLDGDIRNIVRLDPTENLTSSGTSEYFGLTSIPSGKEPSVCLNDSTSSVFRYTTLNRKLRSERMLRAWSETADADKTNQSNELRITADATLKSLFNSNGGPKELSLVDADRRYIRRYRVSSHTMNLDSRLDPYTGLPAVDGAGAPMTFDYVSVYLRMPLNVEASAINKKTAVFITGSEVYASNTFYVCLRRSDHSLIKYNEVTEEVEVLLPNPQVDFSIESFKVSYFATKAGIRVEPANFVQDMLTAANSACHDTVLLRLNLKASDAYLARSANQGIADTKADINRSRTVFSQNLNVKRPLGCL